MLEREIYIHIHFGNTIYISRDCKKAKNQNIFKVKRTKFVRHQTALRSER